MNFLESNQRQNIRFKSGNVLLFEPNDEQRDEIEKLLLNQDIKMNEEKAEVDYSIIRYILRNCCENGAFIDEYTDEEIINKINSGNRTLKKLEQEAILIMEEVLEDMYFNTERELKGIDSLLNIFNRNDSIEKLKVKFNKLSKKHKWNLTFDDLLKVSTENNKIKELN